LLIARAGNYNYPIDEVVFCRFIDVHLFASFIEVNSKQQDVSSARAGMEGWLALSRCNMPAPLTAQDFLELTRKSGVIDAATLDGVADRLRAGSPPPADAKQLAGQLVRNGLLTIFQAEQLLRGRWRGFNIGKYQILERLGFGGMGIVYLAEHKALRRRVAVKVLPVSLAESRWFLDRFYKEAQAVAALNHPNIVCAHDIDQDGKLHFLVMEYVDGANLQEIINKHGPMAVERAAHYIRQAALGLQHSHERGLVHRDIKPGNLLLDRQGVVKILDMGLAHFFKESAKNGQAKSESKRILGTEDYLAPEQIVNSDDVDIRADIYSLGATFYFLLTGQPPFHETSMAYHKLIHHLGRSPKPVRSLRPEVPEGIAKIVDKMMAKNPWDRYRTPQAVVHALAEWTRTPIPPPPEPEMPKLCPAARRVGISQPTPLPAGATSGAKSWVLVTDPRAPATSDTKSPAGSAKVDTLKETVNPSQPPTNTSSVNLLPPSGASSGSQSKMLREFLTAESEEPGSKIDINSQRGS
jgi:serine/threonine protein kinase